MTGSGHEEGLWDMVILDILQGEYMVVHLEINPKAVHFCFAYFSEFMLNCVIRNIKGWHDQLMYIL